MTDLARISEFAFVLTLCLVSLYPRIKSLPSRLLVALKAMYAAPCRCLSCRVVKKRLAESTPMTEDEMPKPGPYNMVL